MQEKDLQDVLVVKLDLAQRLVERISLVSENFLKPILTKLFWPLPTDGIVDIIFTSDIIGIISPTIPLVYFHH